MTAFSNVLQEHIPALNEHASKVLKRAVVLELLTRKAIVEESLAEVRQLITQFVNNRPRCLRFYSRNHRRIRRKQLFCGAPVDRHMDGTAHHLGEVMRTPSSATQHDAGVTALLHDAILFSGNGAAGLRQDFR